MPEKACPCKPQFGQWMHLALCAASETAHEAPAFELNPAITPSFSHGVGRALTKTSISLDRQPAPPERFM